MENYRVKHVDDLASCLKETHRKLASNNTLSALAIADSLIHSCVMQIPSGLKTIEIEELVALTVDKILPYSIDAFSYDFVINGLSQTHPGQLDVHIVAVKIDAMNPYVEAVRQAGLVLRLVDVESFAIKRALKALAQPCKTPLLTNVNITTQDTNNQAIIIALGLVLRDRG